MIFVGTREDEKSLSRRDKREIFLSSVVMTETGLKFMQNQHQDLSCKIKTKT